MRLFIAVMFDEETKDKISQAITDIRAYSSAGDFTPRQKLHITVLFLGETNEDKLQAIINALDGIKEKPFHIKLSAIGNFCMGNKGELYYLAAEESRALKAIHNYLRKKLCEKGFSPGNKNFKPHVTLCRRLVLNEPMKTLLMKSRYDITYKVTSINLMKSERINGCVQYCCVYSKKL